MLPDRDTAWPPRDLMPVLQVAEVHDAWLVGNPERLSQIYGGFAAQSQEWDMTSQARAHGIRNLGARLASSFWGRKQPAREARTRLHVPIATDIAEVSAGLLFGDRPTFMMEGSARLSQVLNEMFMSDSAVQRFNRSATMQSALGGTYLRWVIDRERGLFFTEHDVDTAVPEWDHGRLAAVTFWRELSREGNVVWRHLERHEPGMIEHGVYRGTGTSLGARRDLESRSELDDQSRNTLDRIAASTVDGDVIPTGTDRLTAMYAPNKTPNLEFRNRGPLAFHGRSDYATAEDIFDQIDEAYSSWMRDVRLAKGRLIVPSAWTQNLGPGKGAAFDEDQEIFQSVDMLGKGVTEGTAFNATQFSIRYEAHRATIEELTRTALRRAGLSPATFGDDSVPVQITATQTIAREKVSKRTRATKIRNWTSELQEFAVTGLLLQRLHFGGLPTPDALPTIEFAQEAQADQESLARTAGLLRSAQAASTETIVRLVNPDADEQWISDEVERIKDDSGGEVEDPTLGSGRWGQ